MADPDLQQQILDRMNEPIRGEVDGTVVVRESTKNMLDAAERGSTISKGKQNFMLQKFVPPGTCGCTPAARFNRVV